MRSVHVYLCTMCMLAAHGCASTPECPKPAPSFAPWQRDPIAPVLGLRLPPPPSLSPSLGLVPTLGQAGFSLYQGISRLDLSRCRFSPTCSRFARQALHDHGAWPGLALVFARLSRGHAPAPFYPTDPATGGLQDLPSDYLAPSEPTWTAHVESLASRSPRRSWCAAPSQAPAPRPLGHVP